MATGGALSLTLPYKVHNPYVTAVLACMGGMLFGFDISSVSGFIGVDSYQEFFGHPQAVRQSGITASMPAGSFAGSLVSGFLSDKMGRRGAVQLSSWIWMIGAAIQCSSRNVGQLIAGRVIAGIAIGIASAQVPVYISEISPKNIRGRLVGIFQWSVTWGIMIMFYISYGLGKVKSNAGWRAGWGIQMVPGFILFIGTLFLEESPRWLAAHDCWEEAIDIIAKVQAKGNRDDDNVRIEIEEIKEAVVAEHESKFTFFDLFRGSTNLRRTMVGLWTQIWQQFTGMNVIMYYVVKVFTMAGYSGDTNLVSSSIQYVINVVMTVPALLFIDRWGRRWTFIIGAILMMTWLWASAGIFATYAETLGPGGYMGDDSVRMRIPERNKAASKAAIAVSYLFVASFAPTWGPGGWIYVSELFPLEQRAFANGLCAAANWAMNFAISMFTLSAFKNITWQTYCIYASCCVAMAIHVYLMFPETKGKTLEEIGLMWEANIPAWKTASWQPPVADLEALRANNGGRAPSIKEEHAHNEFRSESLSMSSEHEKARV